MRNLFMVFSLITVFFTANVARADDAKSAYRESVAGLERQVADILSAAAEGRKNPLTTGVSRLAMPGYRRWFAETFGAQQARPLVEEYAARVREIDGLKQLFADEVAKGRTTVRVTKHRGPKDPSVRGLQRRAYQAMRVRRTLYTVSLTRPGEPTGMKLWSFVYKDGAFRFVGKMRALTEVKVPVK